MCVCGCGWGGGGVGCPLGWLLSLSPSVKASIKRFPLNDAAWRSLPAPPDFYQTLIQRRGCFASKCSALLIFIFFSQTVYVQYPKQPTVWSLNQAICNLCVSRYGLSDAVSLPRRGESIPEKCNM